MKLFSKIAMLAVGAAMATGVAVAAASNPSVKDVGASVLAATFTCGEDGEATHNDGTSASTYEETVGDYTLSVSNGVKFYTGARDATGNGCFKFGTSSAVGSMSFTVPSDVILVKIYVAGYKANSAKISVNSGSVQTITTLSNNGAYTAVDVDTSSSKNVSFTSASGGVRCMINTIEYYTSDKSNPEISLSLTSLDFLSNGAAQTITVTPNDVFTGTPTISVSGTPSYVNVGVSGLVLTVSPKAIGTEEVTVNAVHDTEEASATFTVTVIDSHGHSADDPFTVADVIALIDEDKTKVHSSVYVGGIISQIDSYNSTYHSITYWISDDGTTTTQFEVYSGKGIDSANFNSVDDIEVGASVVICGDAKFFSSQSVYEFDKNNYQVSYSAPAKTPESLSLNTDSVTKDFLVGDTFSYAGLVVTVTYTDSNTKEVTPTSVSEPDMSSAGVKTVTVSYTENGTTVTATYDINVADTMFTVSFDANEGSGTMDPVDVVAGSDYPLPECTFTAPEGMTFDCWVDSDGFEITVIEGIDDDVTVYAYWKNLWTVSFNSNGGSGSQDPLQVGDGESCDLPACTFTAPEGKVFDHWEVGGVEKTSLENVTSNVEVTATWKDAPTEVTVTYIFSEHYDADTELDETNIAADDNIGFLFNKRDGGTNATKYYTNGTAVRWYGGGTLAISATTGSITSITITYTQLANEVTASVGTYVYDSLVGSWTGNASSVTFTQAGTSGQDRISQISVTYDTSVVPPTPTTYTITYNANGGTGEMSPTQGESPAVVACTFTREGYEFDRWNDAADGSGKDYSVGETVSADITLYAQWNESGGGETTAARCYTLVESESQLVAGAKYIITGPVDAEKGFYALSTNQKSSNRGTTAITNDSGTAVVDSSEVEVITLGGSTGAWNLGVTGGYLYAASSSNNQLKTEESIDGNGNANWAITFSEGVTSIVAQGTNSRNVMQYNYNSGSPLVACYGSASQTAVSLYRLDFEATLLHNVTCNGSSHSMPEGYTWNEDLKAVFNDLPESERLAMATAEAAADSGLERYDFIVGKYNPTGSEESDYQNFIGRSITPRGSYFGQGGLMSDNNTMIIVVTVVAITSISSIAVLLILKRRKSII